MTFVSGFRQVTLAALIVGAPVVAGCLESSQPSTSSSAGKPSPSVPALLVGKAADVKAAVAAQRGKVVVLDFWATY